MTTKEITDPDFKNVTIYPFWKYGNSTFLPTKPLIKDTEDYFRRIKELNSRKTDILLCTTMKSDNLSCVVDFNELETKEDPRLFHTHLPFRLLPQKHIEKGYKIISLNRNPKDRWVSQYKYLHGKIGVPDWTWDQFFDDVILKDDLYDGWFQYTKDFEKAMNEKAANILPITFEELKKDQCAVIRKLAEFLDLPCSESFVKEVADKCGFDNLSQNKLDSSVTIDPNERRSLFRKGLIGEWKNVFTVSQNEQFDRIYEKEMH